MVDTTVSETPRPDVSDRDARAVLAAHWGIDGPVRELGSQQDRNFLVTADDGRFVLKLANAATALAELEAQNEGLRHLVTTGLRVPAPVPAIDGDALVAVEVGDQRLLARVLRFVDGDPLIEAADYGLREAEWIGDVAGRMSLALAAFVHPGTERLTQWDVRRAAVVVDDLIGSVADPDRRQRVRTAATAARARLTGVTDGLPEQVVHGDLTDDNLVRHPDAGIGVIDFGDLMTSWRVSELVSAAACAYMRDDPDRLFLATVRAFAAHVQLTDAELAAVWPLVVLRTAVLVVSGEKQLALDGDNDYAETRGGAEWRSFVQASERDVDEMTLLIRAAAGRTAEFPAVAARLLPGAAPTTLDWSVTSDAFREGDWLDPEAEERALAVAREAHGTVLTRFGEYRLTRTRPLARRGSAHTFALGVDLAVSSDTPLHAPFDGMLWPTASGVALRAGDATLWIDGIDGIDGIAGAEVAGAGRAVAAGTPVGTVRAGTSVWVQVQAVAGGRPPAFGSPLLAEYWREVSPDPSGLLGVAVGAPRPDADAVLARRDAVFAASQEHYYARPPQIERGWREFLIDTEAQTYVDVVNNVTLAGHAHPGIVRAAARQWELLNTNSRFHYAAVTELAERLAEVAPEGLDRVFLVNSGSEAVDLALRLAQVATGRPRILAAREAYHGWTVGADAVSTSIGDNPRALETRPAWVELMDAPNPVRGTHRGAAAGLGYLADLDAQLDALGEGRSELAGVILEPIFGNGGGVLLPEGYLAGVYERVRALGGVCISDEVQVGYGRLGEYFWGHEQQGAVPDVIAVAKAMGNGQPLGAVITTAAIADAFEQEGSFFSSAGGSPVSARVGIAVLDALRDEDLQGNARRVGGRFGDALRELGTRHPSIGVVHGMGLYLGVELVEDAELTPATALAARVCDLLLAEGCIVQPTGDHKNVLKIKPPLCITAASVEYVVAALDRALTGAEATAD